jgi:two-component system chemotaxis response regulator CheB
MPRRDIVVIGASAGGVDALSKLVSELPEKLPAALFVVLHIPAHSPSFLTEILQSKTRLSVIQARDELPIEMGKIYVASPDKHLLVHRDRMRVVRGPRENRHRPAIDPLFRSAATAYGSRVIGVLLSGLLDDGSAGFNSIKKAGGFLIVQDLEEALYSEMPAHAASLVDVDSMLPLSGIAQEIVRLSTQEIPMGEVLRMERDDIETKLVEFDKNAITNENRKGEPSVYACPDCKGVLWEIKEDELIRYRCRSGHGFSAESLAIQQGEVIENALWTALTTLEERASFLRKMASGARKNAHFLNTKYYEKRIKEAEENAEVLRKILIKSEAFEGIEESAGKTAAEGEKTK